MLWGEPTFTFIHLAHLPVIPDSLTIGGGHTPQLQDGITRLHSSQQQKENGLLYLVSLDTSNQKKKTQRNQTTVRCPRLPPYVHDNVYIFKKVELVLYQKSLPQNVISYVYVMSLLSRSFWNFSSWHNAKNKTMRISTRCVHAHVCFCDVYRSYITHCCSSGTPPVPHQQKRCMHSFTKHYRRQQARGLCAHRNTDRILCC